MTTKVGRFSLELPNPYDSHDPIAGRPGISPPVRKNVTAGAWLTCDVCIERTNVTSSTIEAVCGRKSQTQAPLFPYCFHPAMPGSTTCFCPCVIVDRRWPICTDGGRSFPR